MIPQTIRNYLLNNIESRPWTTESSATLLWNPHISNKYRISDIRVGDYSRWGLLYCDLSNVYEISGWSCQKSYGCSHLFFVIHII